MPLTRTVKGERPRIDVQAEARRLAAKIADVIRARVARGLDVNDKPFARYDPEYAAEQGSKVDLGTGDPGGLMATLRTTVTSTGSTVTITVKPAPQHMKVGAFLHYGTPKMKARPWLGLSPRDLVVLRGK